ncbi:MAG: alanine--tRNA ligase [Desulfomonilaceae bacterium]
MTGAELRELFLNYFEERNHTRVASSSLIPKGDATLLFANAGMVQFKGVFTGAEKRLYNRAVTAQKCLRVSGKHNDLENVGHTARHHTFFEMLGNFSFGDYFKEDAIAFGWEFLTKTVGLSKELLHVTIYKDDDEAFGIWRKVLGPGTNPITRLGEKDNFWSMGDTGPCGPCSEIHIDMGQEFGCAEPNCAPGCDCDRFLELWNLVFMQYDRDESGQMTPLPRPSIDTGLGLERLAAVVQGVHSNWESDLFRPIIQRVEELSDQGAGHPNERLIATRVIADHVRAAAYLIADEVLPSNSGRGYVLRRILRRAVRYAMNIGMRQENPFLHKIVPVIVSLMGDAYPELKSNISGIEQAIEREQDLFLDTLGKGLVILEQKLGLIEAAHGKVLPGAVAFQLYDTYGFPPDVTADIARERGLLFDQAGFDGEMARQQDMSRRFWKRIHAQYSNIPNEVLEKGVNFTGYEKLDDFAVVLTILKDGEQVQEAKSGDRVEIITDKTPFYGESGGQVGDHGIISRNGDEIEVEDTVKPFPDVIMHRGFVKGGTFRVGDKVSLKVSEDLRRSIMANHSATHLLQWALREVLGDHVKQSGSLVEAQRLRFDFTHSSPLTADELSRVEALVNQKIRENFEVVSRTMPIEEAMKEGAIALFGEKYGDTVRMVSMGGFSKELCGGTHAKRTGDIGLFKIVSEGGIAAGVRRIEAVTGKGALDYVWSLEEEIKGLSLRLKGSRGELVHKLEKLIEEKKNREREVEVLKKKLAGSQTTDILEGVREVKGVRVLTRLVEDVSSPKDLREYADRVKDRLGSGIALLGAKADGKALLIALVTRDLTNRFHAGNIVKRAAEILGGSGGGRPDMAQAGGPHDADLDLALKSVEEFLS